jgi:glycosyltransferase involved in cell wall biosynthesis
VEQGRVAAACAGLPPHIQWELAGHVPNEAVLDFYRTNHVSLFVSLSSSEGLPVSMMEAISFGIPIMGCRVNGVPEIVVDGLTGLLLDVEPDEREATRRLQQALDSSFDRRKIREFFMSRFEAEKNYSSFSQALDF